jgi:hypothetical protein
MRRISKMSLFCSILVGSLTGYDANAEECHTINAIGNAKRIVDCPTDQKFEYCFVRSNLSDRAGWLTGQLEFLRISIKEPNTLACLPEIFTSPNSRSRPNMEHWN